MTRSNILKKLACIMLAALMCAGSLALTGCGSDDSSGATTEQAATQDNCYGDDLPVVNK